MNKDMIARNASCDAITGLVNTGTNYSSGYVGIFNADTTMVARLFYSNPAYSSAVDSTAYAYPITDATALRDATAVSYGVFNRDSTRIWQGIVSSTPGAGDLVLETTALKQGMKVTISSAYYVVPA